MNSQLSEVGNDGSASTGQREEPSLPNVSDLLKNSRHGEVVKLQADITYRISELPATKPTSNLDE